MTRKTEKRRALLWAAGAAAAGVGLSLALYRHPLVIAKWYVRRTLILAGLRQRINPRGGGQLSYYHRRRRRDRSDETVVLVHGLGGHAGDWYKTVRSLQDYDVVVVDLPGHGDSQLDGLDWGSETIFEIFSELLDEATGTKPVILVGNSLGGWISMLYAMAFPQRVEKLILVNSAGLHFHVRRRDFVPESRDDARRIIDAVFGQKAPRLPNFMLDSIIEHAGESPIVHAIESREEAPFIDDHLSELKVPTEIIWGAEDQLLPKEHAYRFQERIPEARLHLIEGAGHSPQVEEARLFNQLLCNLLESKACGDGPRVVRY